jgi:hypothetical protein
MRNIIESTKAYEAWMRERTNVSDKLLEKKHRKMADGAVPFLRATFYRWVEQWPKIWKWGSGSRIARCKRDADQPVVGNSRRTR